MNGNVVRVMHIALLALLLPVPGSAQQRDTLRWVLEHRLEELRVRDSFPGATAAVSFADGRSAEVAVGWADIERGKPMRLSHRMLAASIGKTFVAAAAVALDRDRRLNLDDPIRKWLDDEPWFERLPNAPEITIRSLLNHSSGMPSHVAQPYIDHLTRGIANDPNFTPSPEDAINYVLGTPPLFRVGEGLRYSETGYILLGLIIEKACDCSYYDLIRERFLVPLELNRTEPSNRRQLPDLAQGYYGPNSSGLPERTLLDTAMAWNPAFEWTGGGLVSTPVDLVKWAQALYGGAAIGRPYLQELLTAVPFDPEDGESSRYGLGVYIYSTEAGWAYGHGGSILGYRSQLLYFPAHRLAVAIQVNRGRVPAFTYAVELAKSVIAAVGDP